MRDRKSRQLCIMACNFSRSAAFREYLQSIDPGNEPWSEAAAKEFILAACQIKSRRELDDSLRAAEKFHALVRIPFLAWQESSR